jgi:hypothetical protein
VGEPLDHSGVSVTETHYAKYLGAGGDEFVYVPPAELEEGEVPADLLARLPNYIQIACNGDPFELPDFLNYAESEEKR